MRLLPLASTLLPLAALPANAEVKSTAAFGFEVAQTATVKAPPEKVYAALLKPAGWWNKEHSYTVSAANLSIEPRIGGCFCEALPDGLAPGRAIGMRGALGPLANEGVDGTLYWRLKPAEGGGTIIAQSYVLGGFFHGDAAGWAPKVDYVLQEQLTRFARLMDTGSPEPAKAP
jgi:hypothetical protein